MQSTKHFDARTFGLIFQSFTEYTVDQAQSKFHNLKSPEKINSIQNVQINPFLITIFYFF